jgi:hemolysin activation/secretion protein
MFSKLKRLAMLAVCCLAAAAPAGGAWAQAVKPDAGSVANQDERTRQTIQRRDEVHIPGPAVVGPKPADTLVGAPGGVSFVLKRVDFAPSRFLKRQELDAIAARYVGKTVDVSQLQRLVAEVNLLYARRNIVTALAYLPAQDLKDGVVQVGLVEGKLGAITVKGARRLSAGAIASKIHVKPGDTVDIRRLAADVERFNVGHLAQIQIALQPGASFGLTDVEIMVVEPSRNSVQVFADNQGVDSVGKYEAGLSYQHYGLFGDDKATLYTADSQGDISVEASYNAPITPWGGRINISDTNGRIHVFQGAYANLNIRGRSNTAAISLTQPVLVNSLFSLTLTNAFSDSQSTSDQKGAKVTDNDTFKDAPGFSIASSNGVYSANLSQSFVIANTRFNVTDRRQSFTGYQGTLVASTRLPWAFTGSFTASGQWMSQQQLSSDQLFQIGGPTTVRGYPTGAAAGSAGYFTNLELHHGLGKFWRGLDLYGFYDNGTVFSTFPSRVQMNSIGAGFSWPFYKHLVADASVGVPLTHAVANQSSATAYFRLTARFP